MTGFEQSYWAGFKQACDEAGVDFGKLAQSSVLRQLKALDSRGPALTAFDKDSRPYPVNNVLSPSEKRKLIAMLADRLGTVNPFAEDGGGNVYGTMDNNVVLWDHEEADPAKKVVHISPTLQEFMASIR
jgi:hypothetical protein